MRGIQTFVVVAMLGAGCTTTAVPAAPPISPPVENRKEAPPPPVTMAPAVTVGGVKVQMIAATLAEDCGGTGGPDFNPIPEKKGRRRGPSEASAGAAPMQRSMAQRVCRQTSMQLSVIAGAMEKPASISV